MAAEGRTALKTYFNTGDTPTEAQFVNLIDSGLNTTDDTLDNITAGSTNVHFTTTDESKLDAIEASADVTDATNVGTAMTGATAKTTPVDADTMPLNDSAASNVLKKVTWANVKATIKAYTDTLYSALGHTHTESDITDLDHDAVKLQGVGIDATVGTPSDGDILVYRSAGTDWVLEAKPAGGSNPAMSDITDVTITTVADNEVMAYDNGTSTWINQTAAEAGLAAASHTHTEADITDLGTYLTTISGESVGDLSDVTITTLGDGEILLSSSGTFINRTFGEADIASATTLSSHTSNTSNPHSVSKGQIGLNNVENLKVNLAGTTAPGVSDDTSAGYSVGSRWIDTTNDKEYVCLDNSGGAAVWTETTQSGSSPAMDDLTDVTITTIASGEILKWNGSAWVNNTLAEAGIADTTAASTTTAGIVELATGVETNTGTDATRAVTPDALDDWTGSAQITTVGTLASGNVDAAVSAASTTTAGKVEIATITETNTGTDTGRAVSPDGLAGSNLGIRYVSVTLNGSTALTTSDLAYFRIPAGLNGMNLVSVAATVGTGAAGSSSSGTPTFTVKNVTDANQMLSTNLTVDANEYTSATAATAAVINTATDDVVTDDLIEVACTVAGTGVTYATVTLGFQLP